MKNKKFSIRSFDRSPEDYQGVTEILKKTGPDTHGFNWADNVQNVDDKRPANDPVERHVAISGEKIIAYGEISRMLHVEDKRAYHLFIVVDPEHRNKGIGSTLFNLLLDLLKQKRASQVETSAEDTDPQTIAFLKGRGFCEFMRFQLSTLDVVQFDPSQFPKPLQAVAKRGIQIRSIAEIKQSDPAWLEKLWKLDTIIQKELSLSIAIKLLDLEEFEEEHIHSDWFDPKTWLIALDGEKWVGETALKTLPWVKGRYGTHITGVIPSHRRRGIATALKLSVITKVKKSGAKYIQTGNDANSPMYNINLMLGFKPEPTIVQFRRVF